MVSEANHLGHQMDRSVAALRMTACDDVDGALGEGRICTDDKWLYHLWKSRKKMTTDLNKPNPARMYDYFLGGDHNFPADRAAAEQIIAMYPAAALTARAN